MTTHLITAGGNRIDFDLNDAGARSHFEWPGSYTDEILRQINDAKFYAPLFAGRKNLVFFDIGANVGFVTLYAQDVCRFVVSIEPSPHFPMLCYLTRPYKHVLPVQIALHSKDEPVALSICPSNSTAHSTAVLMGGSSLMVNGQKLSTILKAYLSASSFETKPCRIDVVKIDVEGAEMDSLTDDEIRAVSGAVDTFYVEPHNVAGRGAVENGHILQRRFSNNGYRIEVTPDNTFFARKQ